MIIIAILKDPKLWELCDIFLIFGVYCRIYIIHRITIMIAAILNLVLAITIRRALLLPRGRHHPHDSATTTVLVSIVTVILMLVFGMPATTEITLVIVTRSVR